MDLRLEGATVLTLGARGSFRRAETFSLVARTAIQNARGAQWNEWTVRFDEGRTSFLTEAAGVFTLYDEAPLIPEFSALVPGERVETGYVVVERGEAKRLAHWGEAEREAPPETYAYVDLSSSDGGNATIDFGGGAPRVFVGRRTTLADLGLLGRPARPYLVAVPGLSRPKGVEVWLDVGDEGELFDARVVVLGMQSRGADMADAARVRWDEYLLLGGLADLRWLVVSAGHWTMAEAVDAGRIRGSGAKVTLDGTTYEKATEIRARVDWAMGELPWHVAVGATSTVADFVSIDEPKRVLTKESSPDQVSWSRGIDLAADIIAKAFRKRALPRPG